MRLEADMLHRHGLVQGGRFLLVLPPVGPGFLREELVEVLGAPVGDDEAPIEARLGVGGFLRQLLCDDCKEGTKQSALARIGGTE